MSAIPDRSIGDFLHAALAGAAAEVAETLPPALANEPDGVHQQRTRVRRLRSILAGYRHVVDVRAADRVRVAYGEWGRELGVVRDIEVRAAVAVDLLTRAGVDDPGIVHRLIGVERAAYTRAHARLVALAGEPRAVARQKMLRVLVEAPGIADPDAAAAGVIASVLRQQARRVRKAARRLDGTNDGYHELRKAARRMRYVAETVAEVDPELDRPEFADLAAAGEGLHDVLGNHRDAVLVADQVARQATLAIRAGERPDPFAVVEELARADAAAHLAAVPEAVQNLRSAVSALPRK
ncbi:hypothetical protein LK09_16250 [Microbacterium mangrovi]|uniref:CHAD domain-containing protein n=1 Tax=Microbacterium mangrovi TaxID=1348253 RepID=A0A0B1ZY80_9MICO|nr:CHAD domain-containing protein [Microbacterium mangrovi]KHK96185.1 hypothetical protein LK09_16250 [Microbacterium mangrovi]